MRWSERSCVAALLLALAWPVGALAAPADAAPSRETLEWPLPWRDGLELRYRTEGYDDVHDARGRQRTRVTATETLRIARTGDDGYLQQWTIADSRFETLEGEPAGATTMQAARDALGDLVLEVELDRYGTDAGVRNLAELSERMRPALHAALLATMEKAISANRAAFSPEELEIRREAALDYIDTVVAWGTSPEAVQAQMGEDVAQFNRFVGVATLEGLEYAAGDGFNHPATSAPLPATIRFSSRVAEPGSDDVLLEWTTRLDRARAPALPGGVDAVDGAGEGLSMTETGWLRYRRSSGVIEMLEATLTQHLDGAPTVKRRRMRLLGGEHDHAWPDER